MTIDEMKAYVWAGQSLHVESYLRDTVGLSQVSAQRNVFLITQGQEPTGEEITRPLNPFEGQIFDDQELGIPVVFLNGVWKNFAGVEE